MQQQRTIPFFNYPALFAAQENELMSVLRDVCSRGAYILQKDCREFEHNIAGSPALSTCWAWRTELMQSGSGCALLG